MPFLKQFDDLMIRPHGTSNWQLVEDLVYEGSDQRFVIPAGYVTDFATVPKFMRWLFDEHGPYTRAAIVHDWLITEMARWVAETRNGGANGWLPPATSRDTDGIFRRIMREEGTPKPARWVMWAAVRVGAACNSRRAYGRQFYKDLPAVLAIGIPAVAVVGVQSLLILLTRLILRPLGAIK
jgi:uncharacterized protein DUF1353